MKAMRLWNILKSCFTWLENDVLKSSSRWLRNKLNGKKLWKEELRKVGILLIGLGLTGPLINGKLALWPLVILGFFLEIAGLLDDDEPTV